MLLTLRLLEADAAALASAVVVLVMGAAAAVSPAVACAAAEVVPAVPARHILKEMRQLRQISSG